MSDLLEFAERFPQISKLTLGTKNSVQLLGILYFLSKSLRFSTLYSVWNLSFTSLDNFSDTGGSYLSEELKKVVV